jgi:hypothetical protein
MAEYLIGRKIENGFVFDELRHAAKTIPWKTGVDKIVRMVIF